MEGEIVEIVRNARYEFKISGNPAYNMIQFTE